METTFKLKAYELTDAIVGDIRSMAKGADEVLVIIRKKSFPKETPAEYSARLKKALDEVEEGKNLVSFSYDEFTAFAKSLQEE